MQSGVRYIGLDNIETHLESAQKKRDMERMKEVWTSTKQVKELKKHL